MGDRRQRQRVISDRFCPGCPFTDDTVLTVAVAAWLLNGASDDPVDYLTCERRSNNPPLKRPECLAVAGVKIRQW